MSADAQETPFSYPSLAGQGGWNPGWKRGAAPPNTQDLTPLCLSSPNSHRRSPAGHLGCLEHTSLPLSPSQPPAGALAPCSRLQPFAPAHKKKHRFPGEQLPKSQKQRQSKGCGGCLVGGTSAPFISVSSSRLRKYLACRAPVPPTSTGIAQIFQLPAAGTSPGTEWIHPTSERCTRGARCAAAPRLLSARTPSPRQCRVLSPGWAPAGQRPGSPGHSSSFFTLQG